ncbi:ABC transporter family-like protein [Leishmania mexicana MHOM/GT/2001/U1103]|uniref:ABC transporter family-like protein n=1 Tax=Leishmania mexicana (strain MHOM/GT/2001/U1103) TaxID=929439 RepID=E9B4G5_LEIMU|nr:ABC transporter family-like protein [Leishmania mexicana MHOM/GT/2001/U1103]CBZ30134.1 ABC transporter family-like protein [Leishmania mexicana MHOM/GT/2001/U1103]
MRLTGAPWFVIPLATVTAVRVVTAIVNLSNRRELRLRAGSRAARDAESLINAVVHLADNTGGGAHPSTENAMATAIDLNTTHRRIEVSQARLRSLSWGLLPLFDCYAVACRCGTVPDAVKADVWNCLCAVVEAHLQAYVSASGPSAIVSEVATALAMCEVLLGQRYHVTRFLEAPLTSSRLLLGTPPRHLLAEAVRKNRDESCTMRSLALFARLLHNACTPSEKALLALLAVVNITYISRLMCTTSSAAVPSALRYTIDALNEATTAGAAQLCTWRRFVVQVVTSAPGRMLASATLGAVVSHLFSSAKEAASDAVLRRFHMTLKMDTLLALTRFDFVADAHWPLPGRVYSALGVVTNFSFADVDRLLDVVAERVQRCRTVWRFPVACMVGWLTRQGLDWLQRCWTRACLMTSFVACYGAAEQGCCAAPRERVGGAECRFSLPLCRAHYGLQILLLAAVSPSDTASASSAAVQCLAEHTRWPLSPRPCLRATQQVLRAVSTPDGAVEVLGARYDAVRELCASPAEEAQAPAPFAATLNLRRASGDGLFVPPSWPSVLAMDLVTLGGDVLEDVMNKVFSSSNGVPIMAAVAATEAQSRAQHGTTSLSSADAVAAVYDVARVVDSGAVFVVPPARPWTLVSSFQFDVQTAQLHYDEHEAYAQSMATLVHVQHTHQPALDGQPWVHYSTPPSLLRPRNDTSAAWRVTFDHVSFRYPDTEHDVLHDITFDVAAGGFLGIVGYSGAGKSTLLLLLSRVYAPTRGHIRINGHPIECIPPRALRRRLGNCWQGDRDTCFLEGISVERNVAYGNLAAACGDAITAALQQACIDTAVAARPSGLREPLRCSEWSGGEVARLMLARAFMVPADDAGVYIFDECTNGIDSVTEAKLFSRNLCRQRNTTRVMVSHRLASVRAADEILVLAHGRIVERGTWTQLLRGDNDSLFCTLYRAQAVC